MKERDRTKEIATRTGSIFQLHEYKRLRNLVKSRLNNDKKTFYSKKFHNETMSISNTWSTAYQVLGQSRNLAPVQLLVENEVVNAPRNMANAFNNIFIKKVLDLKSSIKGPMAIDPLTRLSQWLGPYRPSIPKLTLCPISKQNLRKIVNKLKGKRSCGIDMVDGYSIKLAAPLIEDTLLHLVNSHYPLYWKVSKISPLHKKEDRTDGENYRPVSNIIFVSQICEKAVYEQLYNHFSGNNLFHPNNHGFRPDHSTASALIQLQYLWLQAAEGGYISAALLLDLSAAFDLVDHQILLGKLELYGLDQSSLKWFSSYLEDRVQYVLVEDKLSDPKPTPL